MSDSAVENIELNPISYKFAISVKIQSIEKDGEMYLRKLMQYFSNHDFKIINSIYKKTTVAHDRIGDFNPYHWNVIEVELNLERLVKNIHSPYVYSDEKLTNEIYDTFDSFRTNVVKNDNKLDYVTWINVGWDALVENKTNTDFGYSIKDTLLMIIEKLTENTQMKEIGEKISKEVRNIFDYYSDVMNLDTLKADLGVIKIGDEDFEKLKYEKKICITFPLGSSYYFIDKNGKRYNIGLEIGGLPINIAITYDKELIENSNSKIHILKEGYWLEKLDADYKATFFEIEREHGPEICCVYLVSKKEYKEYYEACLHKELII